MQFKWICNNTSSFSHFDSACTHTDRANNYKSFAAKFVVISFGRSFHVPLPAIHTRRALEANRLHNHSVATRRLNNIASRLIYFNHLRDRATVCTNQNEQMEMANVPIYRKYEFRHDE